MGEHARQMLGQGRRIRIGGDIEVLLHAVPAMAVVVQAQAFGNRRIGAGLQGGIDGGGDVVALVEHVAAVLGDHFLAHQLGHVWGIDLHRWLVRLGVHRHRLGRVGLGLGDEAQVGHALQHVVVAAFARALGVADRVAAGRELGDAGQRGHLVQAQVGHLLAVVVLGCSTHAVSAVTEEALVQIQLEDLVLGQLALDLARQQDLGQLAGVAVFGIEKELPRNLLGDGRATRHALGVGTGQQPDRAGDALVVHAAMLVEARILGGQERLLEPLRNLLHLDGVAARLAIDGHQPAIARVHVHRLLQFDLLERLHVRQLGGNGVVQAAGGNSTKHGKHDERGQDPAQPTANTGHVREIPIADFLVTEYR